MCCLRFSVVYRSMRFSQAAVRGGMESSGSLAWLKVCHAMMWGMSASLGTGATSGWSGSGAGAVERMSLRTLEVSVLSQMV